MSVQVRPAMAAELGVLAELLGRAFVDDPAWVWIYPQPDRARRLTTMYRSLLPAVQRRGATVLTDGGGQGAAVFQRSIERDLGRLGTLAMTAAMIRSGAKLRRCQTLAAALAAHTG